MRNELRTIDLKITSISIPQVSTLSQNKLNGNGNKNTVLQKEREREKERKWRKGERKQLGMVVNNALEKFFYQRTQFHPFSNLHSNPMNFLKPTQKDNEEKRESCNGPERRGLLSENQKTEEPISIIIPRLQNITLSFYSQRRRKHAEPPSILCGRAPSPTFPFLLHH